MDLTIAAVSILANSCVSLCLEEYLEIEKYLIVPKKCIIERFNYTVKNFSIDISKELEEVIIWVTKAIEEINEYYSKSENPGFSFTSLWEMDSSAAIRELHRVSGCGISFWDDHDYEEHGFYTLPKVPYIEPPYYPAMEVNDKLMLAINK